MPGLGRSPWRKAWQAHSSILAWRIPWTEEPGRLQLLGSQRVGHDLATKHACTDTKIHTCSSPLGEMSSTVGLRTHKFHPWIQRVDCSSQEVLTASEGAIEEDVHSSSACG